MKSFWSDKIQTYDGSQLRSLYGYLSFGVQGSSIVGWRGPCNIPTDNIVDGEDLLDKSVIRGGDMVHFIIERFHSDLVSGVMAQRLMACHLIEQTKLNISKISAAEVSALRRSGDDVYLENRKFNISIATQSPMSNLIHFAFNITNENTPVPTISLVDFGIEPKKFSKILMEVFCSEIKEIAAATTKVKWVR